MKKEIIIGRVSSLSPQFGFLIPKDRDEFGGDFYIHKKNFNGAKDGDTVEAEILAKTKGKKPEVKIIAVLNGNTAGTTQAAKKKTPESKNKEVLFSVEGVYSSGDGNFGFIDVEGEEKGYFVYGPNKKGALDGDTVRANIVEFKDKQEGIVTEIIGTANKVLTGEYTDNGKYGFVKTPEGDIFIAGSRKNNAEDGDRVEVKIIKTRGKNPEGVIEKIL